MQQDEAQPRAIIHAPHAAAAEPREADHGGHGPATVLAPIRDSEIGCTRVETCGILEGGEDGAGNALLQGDGAGDKDDLRGEGRLRMSDRRGLGEEEQDAQAQ